MTAAGVSVVVVAYDTGPRLVECVDSVLGQCDVDVEVVVVNNGSPAPELVEVAARPRVEVVEPGENLGFPAGCNLGAAHATRDILFFLNPDAALVGRECLNRIAAVAAEPGVGAAMPLVVLRDDPTVVNSSGGVVHLSGLGWAGGFGVPVDAVPARRSVPNASGAAMAMRKAVFDELGGFCGEFFLYHEDIELSWRAHLAGYDVVAVNGVYVAHDYEFGRNAAKLGLIERNRIVLVATCFSSRLIALVLPVLAVYEVLIVVRAAREGWLGPKADGWRWCWRHRRWIRDRRRRLQRTRVVGDRHMARYLHAALDPGMLDAPKGAGPANRILTAYWSLAQRAL